ncbi:dTDP-glucose 4,6-dehydratase [Candidatus Bipolaricaulota bacterium]
MTRFSRLLVTGGAGFIGSNFIRFVFSEYPEAQIVNVDKLTYAGNLENLKDIENDPRYSFVKADIANAQHVEHILQDTNPAAIVNFAAESHVDRSILGAAAFIETNVRGTMVLLEAARKQWEDKASEHRFVQVSTDEVYGDLGETDRFREATPLSPNNPYSASKASADLLCRAYSRTHKLPVIVTRCSNNYGPYQFPEKLVPLMIQNALKDKSLPVYGDGTNVRDWIHVLDHCRAIDAVLRRGRNGEVYNIGADTEIRNIDLVGKILAQLGKPNSLIRFVRDRPGHDRRYAIDASKLRTELDWKPGISLDDGLEETVEWYMAHPGWVQRCTTGEYLSYYERNYEGRV